MTGLGMIYTRTELFHRFKATLIPVRLSFFLVLFIEGVVEKRNFIVRSHHVILED